MQVQPLKATSLNKSTKQTGNTTTEEYLSAKIISIDYNLNKARVRFDKSEGNRDDFIHFSSIYSRDLGGNWDMENLIDIKILNEPELIYNLQERYLHPTRILIYTYIGQTLLSLNPFRNIDSLYSQEKIDLYFTIITHNVGIHQLPAHIFSISALAIRQLYHNDVISRPIVCSWRRV